ncbi:3-hydroxyacyl-CoA dehydrogenase-like protein [Saccharata proteae CBS 121410]|uniref:3-hydroxyacyl-CoA dehydrogenase-like protein n=1 Tax=Saccharata proteae CBS 121410 TaxID=1314787 RepID=A0A6A5YCM9_9PEZI|nr:3-hydroxyacyl-CoA dehydrogenase-like protein [Saccharata proteae CBS 121410]
MTWNAPNTKGRPVAVLGGGVLGRRIACTWAAAGFPVHIRDPSADQRTAAIHYIDDAIHQYAEELGTAPAEYKAFEGLEEAVAKAWLVIEAVPEKLELKIDAMGEVDKVAPADCIIASNSSSYKTSEMLEKVDNRRRNRILNTHYMMPPTNRIVELMTDGETAPEVFPFLQEKLRQTGMHPVVAQKESTGFIINRVWAAIKRECLSVLAEGVSDAEQLDAVFKEFFKTPNGPVEMMDAVGLDTVSLIEQHYIKERPGLGGEKTVDFLQRDYISQGKLGAKSGKGGLYPPGHTVSPGKKTGDFNQLAAPTLYFLDVGMGSEDQTPDDPLHNGKIVCGSAAGGRLRTLIPHLSMPDGIDVVLEDGGRMFWTNMGVPSDNDGSVMSAKLDGSDVKTLFAPGEIHTPKQVIIDKTNKKLYVSDREGFRVHRSNLDGSGKEVLIQTGDFNNPEHVKDQLRWCVGIAVDEQHGKFYWTQKGTSKGNQGRIFRASIEMPKGCTASNRSDIETLFEGLPEPIDLEIQSETETLYWTDRGELPYGNTLNKAHVGGAVETGKRAHEIIARQLHEAIGLKLDEVNKHIYATDLGGCVYRFDMDGKNRKRLFQGMGSFTGIALAHVG